MLQNVCKIYIRRKAVIISEGYKSNQTSEASRMLLGVHKNEKWLVQVADGGGERERERECHEGKSTNCSFNNRTREWERKTVTNIRHLFSFGDKKKWLISFTMTNVQCGTTKRIFYIQRKGKRDMNKREGEKWPRKPFEDGWAWKSQN